LCGGIRAGERDALRYGIHPPRDRGEGVVEHSRENTGTGPQTARSWEWGPN